MMDKGKLYLVGSLRNPRIIELGIKLRKQGWDVFDDWMAAGPEADDYWRDYEKARGHDFTAALQGHAAKHVFEFDKKHLDESDIVVLALPAGKSGHLELGYAIGSGKPGFILMDQDPDRFDVMYAFATHVAQSEDELFKVISFFGKA